MWARRVAFCVGFASGASRRRDSAQRALGRVILNPRWIGCGNVIHNSRDCFAAKKARYLIPVDFLGSFFLSLADGCRSHVMPKFVSNGKLSSV